MAHALNVVRNRSAFLILREAFYGATRFEEFAERTGLSEPVTATRLRELTDEGLLEREPYQEPGQRTRRAYRLTEKGSDLLPVLVALMQWGDKWVLPGGARGWRSAMPAVGRRWAPSCGVSTGTQWGATSWSSPGADRRSRSTDALHRDDVGARDGLDERRGLHPEHRVRRSPPRTTRRQSAAATRR